MRREFIQATTTHGLIDTSPFSAAYEPIHPPDAITTNLPVEKQYVSLITMSWHIFNRLGSLGVIDASTVEKVVKVVTEEEKQRQKYVEARPPLDTIINLNDFEVRESRLRQPYSIANSTSSKQTVARKVISEKAWVCFNFNTHAARYRYLLILGLLLVCVR